MQSEFHHFTKPPTAFSEFIFYSSLRLNANVHLCLGKYRHFEIKMDISGERTLDTCGPLELEFRKKEKKYLAFLALVSKRWDEGCSYPNERFIASYNASVAVYKFSFRQKLVHFVSSFYWILVF